MDFGFLPRCSMTGRETKNVIAAECMEPVLREEVVEVVKPLLSTMLLSACTEDKYPAATECMDRSGKGRNVPD